MYYFNFPPTKYELEENIGDCKRIIKEKLAWYIGDIHQHLSQEEVDEEAERLTEDIYKAICFYFEYAENTIIAMRETANNQIQSLGNIIVAMKKEKQI